MYKDEELSNIFKNLFFAIIITIILIIPIILYVYYKYDNGTSELIEKVNNEDKLIILITNNDCSECNNIKNSLDKYNIYYIELDEDKDNDNYKLLLSKIKLDEKYASSPSLIYIENGELNTNINDFNEVDLDSFLRKNNLIGE